VIQGQIVDELRQNVKPPAFRDVIQSTDLHFTFVASLLFSFFQPPQPQERDVVVPLLEIVHLLLTSQSGTNHAAKVIQACFQWPIPPVSSLAMMKWQAQWTQLANRNGHERASAMTRGR